MCWGRVISIGGSLGEEYCTRPLDHSEGPVRERKRDGEDTHTGALSVLTLDT
jgi:hypothetical protein